MNQQDFQRKLAAAKELGLETDETYIKVGEDYYQKFEIKKGEEIIENQSFPVERDVILENLTTMRNEFTELAAELQNKIDKINALDGEG